MSALLRSGKLVQLVCGAARCLYPSTPLHLRPALRPTASNLSPALCKEYSTEYARKDSIEPLLQRLDEDVRRYGRLSRRDLDEVLEEVRVITSVTSSQSLLVIRCCGNLVPEELPAERTKLVNQIWKTLSDRGIPMDISHYNALLRVYIENDHDFSTADILKELESKGLEPNRVTYQRLMWHHCQRGDVEGASNILELMRQKNLPLSEAVLDALVLGHVRQNNLEGARSVLTAMSTAGLNPTSRTYAILIGGSAKQGDLDSVKEQLKECEKQEIYLSDRDFMDIVEEFAIGGHNDHVDYIIQQMQKNSGYNQEAINLILRLINRGCEDAAFKLLQSMTRTSLISDIPSYQSAFFVRQLVKANIPKDTLISICDKLYSQGFAPKAYYVAADVALQNGKMDVALALFRSIQKIGGDIRQHYFWPLMVINGKNNNIKGILDILKICIDEFNISPSFETIRDYVAPFVYKKRKDGMVDLFRETGVSLVSSVRGTIAYLLSENLIKEAADIATIYGTKGSLRTFGPNIIGAFSKTKDVESFIKLVILSCSEDVSYQKYSQTQKGDDQEDTSTDVKSDQREIVGRFLNNLVSNSTTRFIDVLPQILQEFLSNGLGITSDWADKVQQRLGEKITNEISELLAKLTSEDLKFAELEKGVLPPIRRSAQAIQTLINNLESKGENVLGLKKQLLFAYIREKNVAKVEELLEKFNDSNFVVSAGSTSILIDMYTQLGQLDKALQHKELLQTKEPDFVIDAVKILRIVQLMLKEDRYEQGIQLLESEIPREKNDKDNFLKNSLCWQIMNSFAEKGDAEKVQRVFDLFMEKNFLEVSNGVLGPLIKVHLVNNDIKTALDVFEECCQKYRCTPWKSELNKRLIMEEDAAGLQKLTDNSTVIHGEINSLYDLVFGFVECGRLKQARKILETPGMRTRSQRFNNACERYGEEGKVECLEGLLEATRELSHIDRSEVFQQLLRSYVRSGDVDKGLGLWTLLQEENVVPSDKFLIELAAFLKASNMKVPFVIPEKASATEEITEKKTLKQTSKQTPKIENLTSQKTTIENAIKESRFDDVHNILISQLKNGQNISYQLVKFYLNSIAKVGDIDKIEEFDALLNQEQKAKVSFDNRRCIAIVNSGRVQQALDVLEKGIDDAKDDELEYLGKNFPKGGIFAYLTDPANFDKVYTIAEKYANRGLLTPINSLWIHCLIEGKNEEATNIWNKYMKDCEIINFRKILQTAYEKRDIDLIDKLLDPIKTSKNVTPKTIGIIYSRKLDILLECQKLDDAQSLLENIEKDRGTLEDINNSTLKRIKNAVELSGGQFKYKIEDKEKVNF